MDKKPWPDEVLDSLQNLQRAEPNPFLFTRIEARLHAKASQRAVVLPRKLAWGLAGFAGLCLLNAYLLRTSPAPSQTPSDPVYQLESARFDLY